MSGIGTRAIENTPCVVRTTKPAASPTARSHSRAPIHHVVSATPSAARSEGQTTVTCVTAPVGHAASAISQASTGGLLRYGASPSRGTSQLPWRSMSRASIGKRASSLLASTRAPASKKSNAPPSARSTSRPPALRSRNHVTLRARGGR